MNGCAQFFSWACSLGSTSIPLLQRAELLSSWIQGWKVALPEHVWKNFQCMYVCVSLCICVCVPSCRCDACFTRNRFYAETDKFYAEKIIFDAHWRFADTSFLLCSKCSSLEILNCSLPFFCSYEIFADTSFLPLSFFEICRMELPFLLINWDLNCWLLFFSAH